MKRKIRKDYRELAKYGGIPKTRKVRKSKSKKAKTPEEIIQKQTNAYLEAKGIEFLRLPDTFFRAIFANQKIPVYRKKILKDSLAGWPDNIAFLPINDKFCLACFIECKSDKGKMQKSQRDRARVLPYNIIRKFEELQEIIQEFENETEKLKPRK